MRAALVHLPHLTGLATTIFLGDDVTDVAKRAKWGAGRVLSADLASLLSAVIEGRRSPHDVAKKLRKLADYVEGIGPQKSAKPAVDTSAEEVEIFNHWRVVSGKGTAKFTNERRAKVRARLRDGYTVGQIKQAIEFICSDPWHTGGNENGKSYVDLELICRNATKLEGYIGRAEESGLAVQKEEKQQDPGKVEALRQAREDAQAALKKGDNDAYNRLQRRIKALKTG